MKFLQKDGDDLDILYFSIGKFNFRWFTDFGEWFIYLEWDNGNTIKGHRFSSAGYMKLNHKKIGK